MLDHNTLSLIKPKRLYDDKDCIIKDGVIEIVFGATKVLAPFVSKLPAVKIKVKDLWNVNLDAAEPFSGNISSLPIFDKWNEIPITVSDTTVFSSISSVGEDTFWLGSIGMMKGLFLIGGQGLTWCAYYDTPKMPKGETTFSIITDWYIFYYLFQMFKDLTGKKIAILAWQEDKQNVYFTNENKDYYLVCSKNDLGLQFKTKYADTIMDYFKNDKGVKPKQIMKKMLQESAISSENKHLLRPCGDIVDVIETDTFFKYQSGTYRLDITKEKK